MAYDLPTIDSEVRRRAFAYLQDLVVANGDVVPWQALTQGIEFEGTRIPLAGQPGIITSRVLDGLPLTIRSAPVPDDAEGYYADTFDADGNLEYSYLIRDKLHPERDIEHGHNRSLRRALELKLPLAYLYGVSPGRYIPHWPVFIIGEDRSRMIFRVAMMDAEVIGDNAAQWIEQVADKRYSTVQVLHRLHQKSFSSKVMEAYQGSCAICRLKRSLLLDAAHILPDKDPRFEPRVSHGIALCKIHHAAYDGNLIGITPNCVIEVRRDVLDEPDGPMLEHGLKGFNAHRIQEPKRPSQRPDRNLLGIRYLEFKASA
jgi:putative restriction endonuclease